LISGVFEAGEAESSRNLLNEMASLGFSPTPLTHREVLRTCCKSAAPEMIMEIHEILVRMGLFPDKTVYDSIVHGLCTHGKVKKAIQVLEEMKKMKIAPDIITINSIILGTAIMVTQMEP
jgi:pentatricopeptide repeat protein